MDKLTEILTAHTRFEDYACTCGWQIKDDNTFDYESLTNHLVEMLRELLAEVWDAGFTNAEEQADGFAGVSGWPKENPYKKETN